MDLQHYIDILMRRAMVIIVVAALTVAVVSASALVITPIYTASATVRVILDVGVSDLSIKETYGDRLMNTYARILTSWPVLEDIADRLELSDSVSGLREKISVEALPKTELMEITVHDPVPTVAQNLANALAEVLVGQAQTAYSTGDKSSRQIVEEQLTTIENELESDRQQLADLSLDDNPDLSQIEMLKTQIKFKEDAYDRLLNKYESVRLVEALRANSVIIVEPASLPKLPSNMPGLQEIALGLVVGLVGGVGLAMVMENLDTRVQSSQQVERLTHLPVLGVVSRDLLVLNESVQNGESFKSRPLEEAYRLLGINLQTLRNEQPLQTILITSASTREGKSTAAAGLAQALAERGQTVFLVESDLRRPAVARMLELEDGPGLSTLLEQPFLIHESLGQMMQPANLPSLFVIGSGPTPSNPTALLASPAMDQLLSYLGMQGQTTLLDAPPVLGLPDVSILAPKAEGIILVVAQGITRRESLRAALKQLRATRANVLGVVFLQKSSKDWAV